MSRLEELIEELCPDGVEFVPIGDVVSYEQPAKYIVKSTSYSNDFTTPVLTAGQSFILGYTDEENGIYEASKDNPVIIFDDFTGAFKWVDFPFKVKSSAIKILHANEDRALLRYIFHIMSSINFSSNEHKRLWIGIYSHFDIPVPPLEIQYEIVHILDNFTELTKELTTELTARKQQYKYYRNELLKNKNCTELKSIGELCNVIVGGEAPEDCVKCDFPDKIHKYPVWGNGKDIYGYSASYKVENDAVCISSIGANTGDIFFHKGKFTPIIRLKVLIPKTDEINTRFLFHVLSTVDFAPKKSSVPNMSASDIKKTVISVPPLSEQIRITDILDNFEEICDDLSGGIPAEIKARQKQYEYYRYKLLTFKELGV